MDGTEEHTLKVDLRNNSGWNEKGFNNIEFGWVSNRMFLNLNGNTINRAVGDIGVDTSDSFIFVGSSIYGVYQANGYFDHYYARKYIYPEPTATFGKEQRLN
jgi:hypothetical protein